MSAPEGIARLEPSIVDRHADATENGKARMFRACGEPVSEALSKVNAADAAQEEGISAGKVLEKPKIDVIL